MKKVGILTYHRAMNYGAFMQAYSFSQKLRKCFPDYDIEIIDFNTRQRSRNDKLRLLSFLKHRGLKNSLQMHVQYSVFRKSISQLKRSTKYITDKYECLIPELEKKYDALIVGSDAVFNWGDIGIPNIFFLNEIKKCKKLSYAASVHMQRYLDVSQEERDYLSSAIKGFEYLGVRDKETENFTKHFNNEAAPVHNCDPTVFIDFNDYKTPNLISKALDRGVDINKPTIILMTKHDKYAKYIKEWYGDKYQLVAVAIDNKYADAFLYNLNPFEWSRIFSYATFTVTEFFHGTLLSLKNETPVICIDSSGFTDKNYEGKSKDLLCMRLNLPEFYFHSNEFNNDGFAERLKDVCNGFIVNDYKEKIRSAFEKEAQSFESFRKALEQI